MCHFTPAQARRFAAGLLAALDLREAHKKGLQMREAVK
jgi:hypothetical protein